jgi:hypothetical protein
VWEEQIFYHEGAKTRREESEEKRREVLERERGKRECSV